MPEVKEKRIRSKWEKILYDSQTEPNHFGPFSADNADDENSYYQDEEDPFRDDPHPMYKRHVSSSGNTFQEKPEKQVVK